jgi:hypothetical protein
MNMQMEPNGDLVLGWIVVALGTVATLYAIVIAIYWLIRPGETDPEHPKRIIMREDR